MLSVTCCDPAISATSASVEGSGADYAGNPALQAHLAADYDDRDNWSYSPSSNLCSWAAPVGAEYLLDNGAPANVASSFSVDAAHYGGGCTRGGAAVGPPTQAAPAVVVASAGPSAGGLVLLAGAAALLLYYLVK